MWFVLSFDAGTVVAMAEEAELHPIGKLMVGYPCIEHTGPLLDIVPAFTSAENKGLYIAKVGIKTPVKMSAVFAIGVFGVKPHTLLS